MTVSTFDNFFSLGFNSSQAFCHNDEASNQKKKKINQGLLWPRISTNALPAFPDPEVSPAISWCPQNVDFAGLEA